MAGVHILTDGAATLPRDADLNYGITILPHALRWGDDLFRIRAELTVDDAVRRWSVAPPDEVLPPSADEVRAVTESVLDWGVEVVTVLGPLRVAATVDRARAALSTLPEGAGASIVETAWLGPALGLIAISAAHAGAEGASRPDVVALVDDIGAHMECVVVRPSPGGAETLERPREAANREDGHAWQLDRLLGAELSPVADAEPLGTAMRRAVAYVHDRLMLTDSYQGPLHMALFSAAADAEAAALATFFEQRYAPHELWVAPADPVLLGQVGVPAFGVAWYRLPASVEVAV